MHSPLSYCIVLAAFKYSISCHQFHCSLHLQHFMVHFMYNIPGHPFHIIFMLTTTYTIVWYPLPKIFHGRPYTQYFMQPIPGTPYSTWYPAPTVLHLSFENPWSSIPRIFQGFETPLLFKLLLNINNSLHVQ